MQEKTAQNTDVELWRQTPGDYYAPSIHVTKGGSIGINVGGHVLVAPVKRWHECGNLLMTVNHDRPTWMSKLALWLLNYKHNLPHPK